MSTCKNVFLLYIWQLPKLKDIYCTQGTHYTVGWKHFLSDGVTKVIQMLKQENLYCVDQLISSELLKEAVIQTIEHFTPNTKKS